MAEVWMDPDGPAVGTVLIEGEHSIWIVVEDRDDKKALYCAYSIYTGNRGGTLSISAAYNMEVTGAVPRSPAADDYGCVLSGGSDG